MIKILSNALALSKNISNTPSNQFKNFVKIVSVYAAHRFFKKKFNVKLHYRLFGVIQMVSISCLDDIETLFDLHIRDVYKISGSYGALLKPDTIIDLGANVGLASIYFCSKYPSVTIYAVEPNPEVFEVLKRNLATLPNVTCINALVTDKDGESNFFVSPLRSHSSSILNRSKNDVRYLIKSFTLPSLISHLGISDVGLIKFDIEGAEFRIFEDFKDARVKSLVGEVHCDLAGGEFPRDLDLGEIFNVETTPGQRRYIIRAYRR